MFDVNNPIWVLAEQDGENIQWVCLELIGKARALADILDVPVEVVLLGSGIKNRVDGLFAAGADTVYVVIFQRLRFIWRRFTPVLLSH